MSQFQPEQYVSEQGWDFSMIAHVASNGVPATDCKIIEHYYSEPASAIESLLSYCQKQAEKVSARPLIPFGLPVEFYNPLSGALLTEAMWYGECEKCLQLAKLVKRDPLSIHGVKKVPFVVGARKFGGSFCLYLYQKRYRFMVSAAVILSGNAQDDRKATSALMAAVNRDNDIHSNGNEASHRAICAPAQENVPSARACLLQLGHDSKGTMETLLMIARSLAIIHRS